MKPTKDIDEKQIDVYLYHGTYIENIGNILRDGHLKPNVTKLMPNKKSLVHLATSFSKAAKYGDVVFEIPFDRLTGDVQVINHNCEVTTNEPVKIELCDVMIFDREHCYKELQ